MNYIEDLQTKIETFINNELDEYALAIDGYWGSGKTYAIEKVINSHNEKKENKHNQMKYISLNGINDLNFSNLNIKGFSLFTAFNMATSLFDAAKGTAFSSLVKENEKMQEDIKILIFDDIERCKCDIDSILGFIDQIKKLGIKIIIVLNSLEIGTSNNEENKELYTKIKEKIIGTTIVWNATNEIIEDFINNINLKNFDYENVKLLKKCLIELYPQFFNDNNGNRIPNLRLLKKVVIHTCYILEHLNWNKNDDNNYEYAYLEIIKNVYVHYHKETYKEFEKTGNEHKDNRNMYMSSMNINKFDLLFVKDYFKNGLSFNSKKYQKELNLLLSEEKEEFNLSYRKFYTENELNEIYSLIKCKLQKNKYPIYTYSNVLNSVITIDYYLNTNYLKEIIEQMCLVIKSNKPEVIYYIDRHFNPNLTPMQFKCIEKLNKTLVNNNKLFVYHLLETYIDTQLINKKFKSIEEIIKEYDYCNDVFCERYKLIDIYKYFSNTTFLETHYLNKNYNYDLMDYIHFLFYRTDKSQPEYIKEIKKIISYLNKLQKVEDDKAKKILIKRHVYNLKADYNLNNPKKGE